MYAAAGGQSRGGANDGISGFPSLPPASYTIAWICALHFEMTAAIAMLDETHADLPSVDNDRNNYTLGRIGQHNVVIACLPEGHYGTVNATRVLADLIRTFKSIRAGLMVGVGGGAPSKRNDVRLGDVVVGTRIMPYELGKVLPGGQIQHTAVQKVPDHLLCTLLSKVRATDEEGKMRMSTIFRERFATRPSFAYPDLPDLLFGADYDHDETSELLDCDACDKSRLVLRRERNSTIPEVHYGGIASGDKLRRDGPSRDEMAKALNVICFEMETAGLMDILPCLPIRGICDYSDSHKHKGWQRYAAACAAAYARVLLEVLGVGAGAQSKRSDTVHTAPVDYGRRQAIMNILKFDHVDSRKDAIKRTYARTCQWLLDNPTFEDWHGNHELSNHHGFLWIRGKPGTGKSTLMKFLYENTRAAHRDNSQHLTASFFFHARGHALERSVAGMYRSLLLQLLREFVDLQMVLDTISSGENGCPSVEVLKVLLEECIRSLGRRQFTCFIDALDEGDEQQITEMVRYFEELAELAIKHRIRMRICFSSRHYPYIDLRHGLRLTLEDQPGHANDLTSYIGSHLRLRCPIPVANLHHQLLERSCGVFLWVVLVVDILNKESYRGGFALMRRLKEIPSSLKDLFADMLKRDQEDMYGLRICIMWILFSLRPLTPSEFYHAMWSGLVPGGLAEDEPPETSSPHFDDGARFAVINSSKGLAEITTSEHPVVQFIHESVRDFLIKDHGLAEIWPDFEEAQSHDSLKQFCASYIEKMGARVMSKADITRSYHFVEYSTEHVLNHAEAAAGSIPQADFLSSFPKEAWIKLDALVHNYKVREYKEGSRLLYILASKSLPNLIRMRMEQKVDSEGVGVERYRRPFFAAVATGSHAAMAALLGASRSDLVDLDTFWCHSPRSMLERTRYRTRTPLTWAVSLGFGSLATLLVRRGTDMKECDGDGVTPFSAAIQAQKEPLIRLFIEHKASVEERSVTEDLRLITSRCSEMMGRIMKVVDSEALGNVDLLMLSAAILEQPEIPQSLIHYGVGVNHRDSRGRTPLILAVLHGYEDTTKVLLEAGANASIRGQDGRSPLSFAAFRGFGAIAKALVDAGADVDFPDADRQTPLHHAVRGKHKNMVSWLVKAGASTSNLDEHGQTPLGLAISQVSIDMVSALIEAGADINDRDAEGRTPLHMMVSKYSTNMADSTEPSVYNSGSHSDSATWRLQESLLSLLLDHGDKEDDGDNQGKTPPHLAIQNMDEALIRILVQNGAHVNSRDASSFTPLHEAGRACRLDDEIVSILLRSGADITAVTDHGITPLHLSAQHNPTMTGMLLEHGAQVNTKDDQGLTPLHWAARECMERERCAAPSDGTELAGETTVNLLVRWGADVNSIDSKGQTPLQLALDQASKGGTGGDRRIIKALLALGGNLYSRHAQGRAPQATTRINFDPYLILGVPKDANIAQIRSAHRRLVLRLHPDKVQDPELKALRQDEFDKVYQAYYILSDETQHKRYDDTVTLAELRRSMQSEANISVSRSTPK